VVAIEDGRRRGVVLDRVGKCGDMRTDRPAKGGYNDACNEMTGPGLNCFACGTGTVTGRTEV
jgi:hypothetical protein